LETNDNIAGVLLSDSISASKLRHIIENLEISSEQINKVTEDLSSVVGNMKEGEGMLNLVATDTAMANQLMRTMQNIEEGTAKFNENMEALKHNFQWQNWKNHLNIVVPMMPWWKRLSSGYRMNCILVSPRVKSIIGHFPY
jgi:hypothetical protein